MNKLLLVILAIAVVVLIDYVVRRVRKAPRWTNKGSDSNSTARLVSADEAAPTETGRFRAQQILAKPRAGADQATRPLDSVADSNDEKITPLPDPFEEESKVKE